MASNCPNCGRELKWYNIKAECPDCGVSIPNFNWEARLEEDNILAEAKFGTFYKTLNILSYSIYGTKLRIARIVLSIVPVLGLLFPWATVTSEKATLSFDLLGLFTEGTNTVEFIKLLLPNFGNIFSAMSGEGFSGPVSFVMLGLLFILLSIISLVVAFFLIFITFKRPKTNAMWIADFIGIILAGVGVGFFIESGSKMTDAAFSITTLEFTNATASVLWGIFVLIGLYFVPMIANILVARADVKSEEELEDERLERVRIKEEKQEQERIRKEAARAEAKKKAEEEQAEKVRKAREALAKKEKK